MSVNLVFFLPFFGGYIKQGDIQIVCHTEFGFSELQSSKYSFALEQSHPEFIFKSTTKSENTKEVKCKQGVYVTSIATQF